MYLAGNAYPEIQFAVHQCAHSTHAPRHSHAIAVKKIAHYLQHALQENQGLTFKTTNACELNLYVDADFAGLWSYEDDQDPVCVKSRTGYVITLSDCPVQWSSSLQKEIALSTLEAEYIALCQSMRAMIPMRRAFVEMCTQFQLNGDSPVPVKSKIFEDNNGCISTCKAPKMTPRTKHFGVKYHFVRSFFSPDGVKEHPFVLEKIDTTLQKADIFTKGLNVDTFKSLRQLLCGW
jgi:hypothetical protein